MLPEQHDVTHTNWTVIWDEPNVTVAWWMFQLYISGGSGFKSQPGFWLSCKVFIIFLYSLQMSAGIVSQTRPLSLPSTSFAFHYTLTIPSLYSIGITWVVDTDINWTINKYCTGNVYCSWICALSFYYTWYTLTLNWLLVHYTLALGTSCY
jgi:hypothetical protein